MCLNESSSMTDLKVYSETLLLSIAVRGLPPSSGTRDTRTWWTAVWRLTWTSQRSHTWEEDTLTTSRCSTLRGPKTEQRKNIWANFTSLLMEHIIFNGVDILNIMITMFTISKRRNKILILWSLNNRTWHNPHVGNGSSYLCEWVRKQAGLCHCCWCCV